MVASASDWMLAGRGTYPMAAAVGLAGRRHPVEHLAQGDPVVGVGLLLVHDHPAVGGDRVGPGPRPVDDQVVRGRHGGEGGGVSGHRGGARDHEGARGVLDGGVVQARLQGVGQLDVADGAGATLDVTGHAGVAVATLALGEGGLLAVEAGGPVGGVHRGEVVGEGVGGPARVGPVDRLDGRAGGAAGADGVPVGDLARVDLGDLRPGQVDVLAQARLVVGHGDPTEHHGHLQDGPARPGRAGGLGHVGGAEVDRAGQNVGLTGSRAHGGVVDRDLGVGLVVVVELAGEQRLVEGRPGAGQRGRRRVEVVGAAQRVVGGRRGRRGGGGLGRGRRAGLRRRRRRAGSGRGRRGARRPWSWWCVGAVVVVVVFVGFFAAVRGRVFDDALGVLEPQAAATRPPASTMVPRSQRVPLRLDAVPVVPRVTRANPNTYCSSRWCGAHAAMPWGAKRSVGSFLTGNLNGT